MLQATALAKFIKKDALLKMIEILMETTQQMVQASETLGTNLDISI